MGVAPAVHIPCILSHSSLINVFSRARMSSLESECRDVHMTCTCCPIQVLTVLSKVRMFSFESRCLDSWGTIYCGCPYCIRNLHAHVQAICLRMCSLGSECKMGTFHLESQCQELLRFSVFGFLDLHARVQVMR